MESRQQYAKICEEYEAETNQKIDEDNPLSQTDCVSFMFFMMYTVFLYCAM